MTNFQINNLTSFYHYFVIAIEFESHTPSLRYRWLLRRSHFSAHQQFFNIKFFFAPKICKLFLLKFIFFHHSSPTRISLLCREFSAANFSPHSLSWLFLRFAFEHCGNFSFCQIDENFSFFSPAANIR